MSIYDRLKGVKSPELDPLLYILHAFHEAKSPSKADPKTPKMKSTLSSGNLKQLNPNEKESNKFVSEVKESNKTLPSAISNAVLNESKATPSLARSLAKAQSGYMDTPKTTATPLLDRDFVGSLKVNTKPKEGKEALKNLKASWKSKAKKQDVPRFYCRKTRKGK